MDDTSRSHAVAAARKPITVIQALDELLKREHLLPR